MTQIEVGFEPKPFEKHHIGQIIYDMRLRLEGHEISRLKIILSKAPGHQIVPTFRGNPESIEKAKKLLGVH